MNNGRRLPLTPEWASTSGQPTVPSRISLGGGVVNQFGVDQTPPIPSSPGITLSMPGRYAVNAHLSLRLNIYNLTNETYSGSEHNASLQPRNRGRRFDLELMFEGVILMVLQIPMC